MFGLNYKNDQTTIPSSLSFVGLLGFTITQVVFFASLITQTSMLQILSLLSSIFFFTLSVFGWRAAYKLIYPILLLLFSLPIWEIILIHPLREITTSATTVVLQLLGIPNYRDHWNLVLPSGHFSIKETCSGLRYFLTGFSLAVVISFFELKNWKQYIVLAAITILWTCLVNVIRVVSVMLIAEHYGITHHLVDDHDIVGWIVFSITLVPYILCASMVKLWVAPSPSPILKPDTFSLKNTADIKDLNQSQNTLNADTCLSKSPALSSHTDGTANSTENKNTHPSKIFTTSRLLFLAYLLTLNALIALSPFILETKSNAMSLPPITLNDTQWNKLKGSTSTWNPQYLTPQDEALHSFHSKLNNQQTVDVYIAEYQQKIEATRSSGKLIYYNNYPYERNFSKWYTVLDSTLYVEPQKHAGLVFNEVQLTNHRETRTVWYVYYAGNLNTHNRIVVKIYQLISILQGKPQHGVIAFSTNQGNHATNQKILNAFVVQNFHSISQQILNR